MSETESEFLAALVENKQTEAAFMNTMRAYCATQGLRGLVDLLRVVRQGATTGKLSCESITKSVCVMAGIKLVEVADILKAEGTISLEPKPPRRRP